MKNQIVKNSKITGLTVVSLGMALNCLSLVAQAQGDKAGGGGGAIVCIHSDGTSTAQLLDLREGTQEGLTIPRPNETRAVQLERALQKFAAISPEKATKVRIVLQDLPNKTLFLDETSPFQLAPPNDTNLRLMRRERNCSLQGVARYDDQADILHIDPVILDAMSATDQAALDFHEALYKVERMGAAKLRTSMDVRKIVAAVFSSTPMNTVAPKTDLSQATAVCRDNANAFQFYVIPQKDNSYRLQFTQIGGDTVWDRTTIDVPADHPLRTKLAQGMVPSNRPFNAATDIPASAAFKSNWECGNTAFSRWAHGTCEASHSYEGVFQTRSNLFPQISVYLSSEDQKVSSSNYPNTHSGYTSVLSPMLFVQNAKVVMGLGAHSQWIGRDVSKVTTEVSCAALPEKSGK